jgi:hypothetical protein
MGISSDGQLWFGIEIGECLDDEEFFSSEALEVIQKKREDGDLDIEEILPRLCGWDKEYVNDFRDKNGLDYWDSRDEFMKKQRIGDVFIGMHCSYDYPIYFVAIKSFSSSRGYAEKIEHKDLMVSQQEINEFKTVCKRIGIEGEVEPSWHLTSMYG